MQTLKSLESITNCAWAELFKIGNECDVIK